MSLSQEASTVVCLCVAMYSLVCHNHFIKLAALLCYFLVEASQYKILTARRRPRIARYPRGPRSLAAIRHDARKEKKEN